MVSPLIRLLCVVSVVVVGGVPVASATCPNLLKHEFFGLNDGKSMPLCQFEGKVVLAVNTASYCGFTSQYDGLEKLYARLKDKGLVVLGFPSNDFGEQEPGSDEQIADFCRLTYGVEFPMVSKTAVKGDQANLFYQALAKISGSTPQWNFHKYLISRDGLEVIAFGSTTSPADKAFLAKIDEFLGKQVPTPNGD